MTYPTGTIGWLQYGGSKAWWRVEVLRRVGNTTYDVRRAHTDFRVGPKDLLIVVGG